MANPVVLTCTAIKSECIRMYFLAPFGTSWACTFGLARCVTAEHPEFGTYEGNLCILTYVFPQKGVLTREESRKQLLVDEGHSRHEGQGLVRRKKIKNKNKN